MQNQYATDQVALPFPACYNVFMQQPNPDFPQIRQNVIEALRLIQTQIQWKPGKDKQHLQTRIDYGHLPPESTLTAIFQTYVFVHWEPYRI